MRKRKENGTNGCDSRKIDILAFPISSLYFKLLMWSFYDISEITSKPFKSCIHVVTQHEVKHICFIITYIQYHRSVAGV